MTDIDTPTTWSLVDAARAGDASAFVTLWDTHRDRVAAIIGRDIKDRFLVEDMVSETFVRAWSNLDGLDDRGRPAVAWLSIIARNLVRDHFKSSPNRTTATTGDIVPAVEADERSAIWGGNPARTDTDAMARLDAATISAYVDRLTVGQRNVILLRFYCGLTMKHACEVLGVPEGSGKMSQHLGVKALRRMMARDGITSLDHFAVRAAA